MCSCLIPRASTYLSHIAKMRDYWYMTSQDNETGSISTTKRSNRTRRGEQRSVERHVDEGSNAVSQGLIKNVISTSKFVAATMLVSTLMMFAVSNQWAGLYMNHIRRHRIATFDFANEIFGDAAGDRFGSSVAISSRTFVVGGLLHDGSAGSASASYVRVYDETTMVDQKSMLVDQIGPDIITGEQMGETSVFGTTLAISGDSQRLAAGAAYSDANGRESGEVRIFEWDSAFQGWKKTVTIPDDSESGSTGIGFGFAVALSQDGNKLVVSSPYDGVYGHYTGSVRTYRKSGTRWIKMGPRLDGKGANSFFGFSLAMVRSLRFDRPFSLRINPQTTDLYTDT
jgi:hypothetical protein